MAVIRLLQQLFKKSARQSKAFDRYQIDFLKKIHSSYSEEKMIQLFDECTDQLNQQDIPLDDTLSEGRLLVSQSQIQLQKVDGLSDKITAKLEQNKNISQPYTIIEHHDELTDILKIYQRVVIELKQNPAANGKKGISDTRHQYINDELQQLILNLDISDAYIKQLNVIRQKISDTNDPLQLPQYCISIIAIIIESTRDERRSSRHFLYTLNDSLTQFYLNFACNVKQAEKTFSEQEQYVQALHKKSIRLKDTASQAVDIESLRKTIYAYVETVDHLLQAKEQQEHHQVRQQFQNMVREIKELQNETKDYQKTIKQQNKKLHIDFLTKIPNRSAWSERLKIEYSRHHRYNNLLNIAIIDIDNFKKTNDTFGHLAGDKVLNVIAQSLQKALRNVDFIARYGGEEFALLLPEINSQQAHLALTKLREKIKNIPFKFKKEMITITISIGYTQFSKEDTMESAFERADNALYQAKSNGRNQIVCADKK